MKEFADLIWTMPAGDFLLLVGAIVVWAHLVAFAVLLSGREKG